MCYVLLSELSCPSTLASNSVYLRRNPTRTTSLQQAEDKKENFHFYSQAICCHHCWRCRNNTGVGAKNKTAVYLPLLEPKKWYAQRSGAAVCFSDAVIPLSISFSHFLLLRLLICLCWLFEAASVCFSRCGRALYGALYRLVICPIQVWGAKRRLIVDKTE